MTASPQPHAAIGADLLSAVRQCTTVAARPITVGISGFGGSGKSTLARKLVASLPAAIRVRGDDFLDPARSHQRSPDWAGVDRVRLTTTVLEPFRRQQPSTFQRFDWSTRQLGEPEVLPASDVLVVDLIGLFHPEATAALDLTIWCDVDLDTATVRGKTRDAALGRSHDHLWDEVWVPNERDFIENFAPRDQAAIRYVSDR